MKESAQQDARNTFRDARWPDSNGHMQGWYDKILRLVEDMDIAPDQYTIKEKFMEGLPDLIRQKVFVDKMSIEYNTIDELVKSALDGEYTVCSQKQFLRGNKTSCTGERHNETDKGRQVSGEQ